MTSLEKLDAEHEEMDRLMTSLDSFGAGDTEPDYHYQDALRNAFFGHKFENLTAGQWELYYGITGSVRAAKFLNSQTRRVCNIILNAKVSEMKELRDWAIRNLWRVDLDK